MTDFGAATPDPDDDYPDYIIPLARAVAAGEVDRGIVICGSGVGASVAANKVKGIRAGLCHDHYSVRQGVEDDDMNVLCLGGRVMGIEVAWDHAQTFISATFSGAERHADAWPRWPGSRIELRTARKVCACLGLNRRTRSIGLILPVVRSDLFSRSRSV